MVETLTVSLEPYEFAASASAICGRFQIGMCYIATNHSCFTQNTRIAVARVYVIRSHQHRSVPLASKVLASSAVSNGKRWVKIGIELDYLCAYWVLLNGMLMRTGKYSASFSCSLCHNSFIWILGQVTLLEYHFCSSSRFSSASHLSEDFLICILYTCFIRTLPIAYDIALYDIISPFMLLRCIKLVREHMI